MSQAKIAPPQTPAAIDQIEQALAIISPYRGNLLDVWSESAVKFLQKLVPEDKLRYLVQALWLEEQLSPSLRQIYRLIVSRVLEFTSKSQTDGIYKAPTTKKKAIPYHQALKLVCAEVRQDIVLTNGLYRKRATLHPTSSETMAPVADESCSICVTSPPYLNNFDFAEMTRMELYFWRYAQSWREITQKVRRHQIVNTTTAPTDLKKKHLNFKQTLSPQMQAVLEPLVETLAEKRRLHAGKKDYYRLVYPYFSQMQSVIKELRRVLKAGSPFHLVVADSALYGVHIDTQNFLAQLMSENGFQLVEIEHLRKRGERWLLAKRKGSQKGLGEYHIFARRL